MDLVVFVADFGGNYFADDFIENGFCHFLIFFLNDYFKIIAKFEFFLLFK